MVKTKSTLGAKATKMLDYINHIIRVELIDGRSFVGHFLAYDAYMNIVLSRANEVITKGMRKDLPPLPNLPGEDISVEKKRGLVLIRGVNIVSVHICGPPPTNLDEEIPNQFPIANFVKFQADNQAGIATTPPVMMMNPMQPRPPMMAPGMMPPRPGMMPPQGMMAPPGMMPPRPGMMPPQGMMAPPGMMPPGMMPPQ